MPLHEYEQMRSKLYAKTLTEEQITKEIEKAVNAEKEKNESYLKDVIGIDKMMIHVFIRSRKRPCKNLWDAFEFDKEILRLEINNLKSENTSLKKVIKIKDEKVSDLEKELNEYKQRKWWQFWRC